MLVYEQYTSTTFIYSISIMLHKDNKYLKVFITHVVALIVEYIYMYIYIYFHCIQYIDLIDART